MNEKHDYEGSLEEFYHERKRGPKMLVERLIEEYIDDSGDDRTYIIIYSTKERRPPDDFYRNLNRLKELAKIENPVRGVLICRGTKIASVAYKLVKKYCPNARLFKADEIVMVEVRGGIIRISKEMYDYYVQVKDELIRKIKEMGKEEATLYCTDLAHILNVSPTKAKDVGLLLSLLFPDNFHFRPRGILTIDCKGEIRGDMYGKRGEGRIQNKI